MAATPEWAASDPDGAGRDEQDRVGPSAEELSTVRQQLHGPAYFAEGATGGITNVMLLLSVPILTNMARSSWRISNAMSLLALLLLTNVS